MKKITFWKSLFLLFALIVGSSSVWGQTTTTYTFTSASWAATSGSSSANWTSGKDGTGFSNNGIQVTTTTTGANGTSPSSFTNITKIVATYNTNKSKGSGTLEAKIGNNSAVSKSWAYSGNSDGTSANFTVQWDYATPQSGNVKITCNTTTNSIYLVSVAITTAPTQTITAVPNNNAWGTVSGTSTITATPNDGYRVVAGDGGYTVTEGTATVVNNGNNTFSVTPSTDCTVQINFEAIPSYTLGYVVSPAGAGNVTLGATSVREGSTSTIEAVANAGYKFTGWSISGTGATIDDDEAASTTMTMGTANVIVTANFEAVTTYPIYWSVNGEVIKTDNVEENTAIGFTAPTSGVPAGYVFTGWVTEANKIVGTTNTEPTANYVTEANSTAEITYYAVMAVLTGGTSESWEEEELANMTASDIFVFSNGTYALNNDNGTTNPPSANSITVSEGKIISDVSDNLKWQVSGNSTDGYTFYPNGDDETWLYCNTDASSSSNNNIRVGVGTRKLWVFTGNGHLKTNDSKTTRYLSLYNSQDFRGYVNTDKAFVPKFYKYNAPVSTYSNFCTTVPSATVTVTDLSSVPGSTYTGKNYATMYYSDKAFAVPAGVVAKTYKMESGVLIESRTYELGGDNPVIPAGEAVVVESEAGASYVFSEVVSSASVDENNALRGTDAATTVDDAGYKYYKLAMNDGLDKVGFFFAVAGGTSLTNGAHKAYLRVATGSGEAKSFYLFEDTTTGINALDNLANSQTTSGANGESQFGNADPMYNLAGQRVNKSYKGVVIVNRKKMLNK